jgi:hypothetical protein
VAKVEFLSFRKFADRVGASEAAVRKAIKAGKISEACIDRSNTKRPKIHFAKGRDEWAKNFTPEKIQNQKLADSLSGKPLPTKAAEVEEKAPEKPEEESEVDESGELIVKNSAPYQESLRVAQLFKAKSAQLEYNERRGRLVEKDAVYKEYYAIAQSVRSAMQGIPDKIIDHIIAAGNDRPEAHRLLYNEITEALEGLSMKPNFK